MQNIRIEIQKFLDETGITQRKLAQTSRVSPSVICLLLKGRQKSVMADAADRLRAAMLLLSAKADLENGKA